MKKRVLIGFATFVSLVLLLLVALQTTPVKRWLADGAESYLLKNHSIRVELGSIDYRLGFPMTILAYDVKLYGGDQNKAIFLTSKKVGLLIPYSSFWRDEFVIEELNLDTFRIDVKNLPQPKPEESGEEEDGDFSIRRITITGGAVRHSRIEVERIEMDASLTSQALRIKSLDARLRDLQLNASGVLQDFKNPHYDLSYSMQGSSASVSEIFPQVPRFQGPVRVEGKIQGVKEMYRAEGVLQSDGVSVNGKPPFLVKADYRIDVSDRKSPYRANVKWSSLPLSLAGDFVKNAPAIASTASGQLSYTGTEDYWKGNGTFAVDLEAAGKEGLPLEGKVEGDIAGGAIRVSSGSLRVNSTRVQFQGIAQQDRVSAKIQAYLKNLKTVASFVPELRDVPGSYNVEATIDGPFQNMKVLWDLTGSDNGMKLVSSGSYFTGTKQLDARASGEASAALLNRFYAADLEGDIRFDASSTGTTDRPVVQATVHGESLIAKGIRIGEATIDAASDGRILNARIGLPDFAATADASYRFASKQFEVKGDVNNLTVAQIQPLLGPMASDVSGTISATLNVSGNVESWRRAQAQVHVQDASFDVKGIPVRIEKANIEVAREIAAVDIQAAVQDGKLGVKGNAGLSAKGFLDLHVIGDADLRPVSKFYPEVQASGKVAVDMQIRGTMNKPLYSGFLASDSFSAELPERKIAISDGKLRADFTNTTANVQASLSVNGSPIKAQGQLPLTPDGTMDLRVTGESDLRLLSTMTEKIVGSGEVAFDVTAKGTIHAPDLSGSITAKEFSLSYPESHIKLSQASAEVQFSGEMIHLKTAGLLNGSELSLDGTLPLKDSEGSMQLALKSFPVGALADKADVTGAVSIKMDARGRGKNPTDWTADLYITPENLRIQEAEVRVPEPVHVRLADGAVSLQRVRIDAGEMLTLSAEGNADLRNGDLKADVQSEGELAILNTFLSDLQASGKMSANVRISGKMTQPQATGVIRIANGFVRQPQSPVFLENVQLEAPLAGNRITLQKFEAVIGGGTVHGTGSIALAGWTPKEVDISLKANRISLRYPMDVRSQLNADLKLTKPEAEYLLAGDVKILRSTLREDIDPRTRLVNSLLSAKKDLADVATSSQVLKLDLRIQTVEDFLMKNDLGKVQAALDLELTGTMDRPEISGRIQVRHGSEIEFEGNQFDVTRGNIDLYGGPRLDPVFDLELFTIAQDVDTGQDYEITLPLSGPLSDLDDASPTSFPPLDPNQIYFLLLTGHADAQISDASSVFFQQQLASYVSGRLFSDVQKELAQTFGLQRVQIQPEMVSSETDPGAKLVLAKDFGSDLSLIYSISLNNSEEQTWVARYRPTRNLSVRFVDQDDGTYTTNIRHVLRFGPGVSFKSLRKPHRPTTEEVADIKITNESALTDAEIRDMLKIEPGDRFDFWDTRDALDKIEEKLQERDFLFASAELETETARARSVKLHIRITGGERRKMIFRGAEVTDAQLEKYHRFWREGFSETAVLELISDDLYRGLWFLGYHKAEVRRTTGKDSDAIVYTFELIPGSNYPEGELVFADASKYPPEELEKDLKDVYPDRKEMITEAVHNADSFGEKVAALYVKRGILQAEVSSEGVRYTENSGVEARFVVAEGVQSRITGVEISDGHTFPNELLEQLVLREGAVYLPQTLADEELKIRNYFENLGYRKSKLKTQVRMDRKTGNITLVYHLKLGSIARVESVKISGNQETDRDLIERRLELKQGDVLNADKLAGAQRRLNALRIFHHVRVQAVETETPDQYEIGVDVMERERFEFTYGFRYDTEKGIGGEGQIADLNLFGEGKGLSLYTRINVDNQLFRGVYHSPTKAGLQWTTLGSISYETGELQLRETDQSGAAEGQRYGLNVQRQYRVWDPFILVADYSFEHLHARPIASPESTPFDTYDISRLGATLYSDTRDEPLNAHRGRFLSFDVQYAPAFLFSDIAFVKSYSQFLNFKPLGRMLWASALRLGVSSDLEPRILTERFFAGGSYSLRGFKKDQVGPKGALGNPIGGEAVFLINEELRFPIYKWFGGAVFYDGGNVFGDIRDFRPWDLRHSAGAGLRFNSPFGLFRFDYGVNLDPQPGEPRTVLHFGFGQAF